MFCQQLHKYIDISTQTVLNCNQFNWGERAVRPPLPIIDEVDEPMMDFVPFDGSQSLFIIGCVLYNTSL